MNKASSFSYSLDNTILSWCRKRSGEKCHSFSLSPSFSPFIFQCVSPHLVYCKFYLLLSQHIMRLFMFVRFGIDMWHCFSLIWRSFNSASYMCLAQQTKPSAKGRDPEFNLNSDRRNRQRENESPEVCWVQRYVGC